MKRKYSVFLGNVGTCNERHCQLYDPRKFTIRDLFKRVASIKKITGVDLVTVKETYDNIKVVKQCLNETGLKVASIVVNLFDDPIYKQGSLSSVSPKIRQKAIDDTVRTMDLAEDLGCDFITIWPGQDGYDYHFQADYQKERTWFADGVRKAMRSNKNIGIALEYKIREPRTHNYINNVGCTILTVKEIGEKKCGIALDIGHAFFAYENAAEAVALMHKWGGNLMHMHMNDNYAMADDDMIVGTVHTIEYLEFIYWLRKTDYKGWFTMDQFAYREDGRDAVAESVEWFDTLESVMDKVNTKKIDEVIAKKDGIAASKLMREILFKR